LSALRVYLPEGTDHAKYSVGDEVKIPVAVTATGKGAKLSVRMVDVEAENAKEVGRAARDPRRVVMNMGPDAAKAS
jgi:hypothetical protein